MARIWIVEDDPKIGLLIEMTVKKGGHEATRFPDAEKMEREMESGRVPDLLLLDLMLREKSGYVVLSQWKADGRTRAIPVIIISARSAEQDKVCGLNLGAEDYITKPFGVLELQARIQTALRRIPQQTECLEMGPLVMDLQVREVYADGKCVDLTQREYDLLLYLARHRGAVVTRGELLQSVWGYATTEDTSRTVDTHIKTLRIKLGDTAGEPRFIKTLRGVGYRLIAGETA